MGAFAQRKCPAWFAHSDNDHSRERSVSQALRSACGQPVPMKEELCSLQREVSWTEGAVTKPTLQAGRAQHPTLHSGWTSNTRGVPALAVLRPHSPKLKAPSIPLCWMLTFGQLGIFFTVLHRKPPQYSSQGLSAA